MPLPEKVTRLRTPAGTGQLLRKLKRGELLFAEGENSRAMYLVKNGMLRLYKKKGDSCIELDTVRQGQIVGELAFLDGNPRSASGEALTECEVMEISGPTFQAVLTSIPDWLKILLKTVVSRLRAASTRIRQLETASTAYDYSEKDGKRASHYVYLSPPDVLRVFSTLLLVASRNGKPAQPKGIEIRQSTLQRYVNQIMGIPIAKLTTLIDILTHSGLIGATGPTEDDNLVLLDPDFLEKLITYMNEENLVEPSKRHDLSVRGFLVMSLITKNLARYKRDDATGLVEVNIAEIRKLETTAEGKEPFRPEEFTELVTLGYAANLNIKSSEEMVTTLKYDSFVLAYRLQRVALGIRAANEQKQKSGGAK